MRDLCRDLNPRETRYVVVGGFAVRAAGYNRRTMDVDLIVAADRENESRVFSALSTLPDNAARELQPGELQQYDVIRVASSIPERWLRTPVRSYDGTGGFRSAAAGTRRIVARHGSPVLGSPTGVIPVRPTAAT